MIIFRLAAALFLVQAGFHAYTAALPLALARGGTPDAAIGLIMGISAVVQIPAAVTGGRLLDAFGGNRLFTVGALAYLAASCVLLLPGVEVGGSLAPFVVVRVLQGLGIALALPSALTMVPHLVPAARLSSGHRLRRRRAEPDARRPAADLHRGPRRDCRSTGSPT